MAGVLVQGTLKWASGERYDGEWRVGAESGVGIYTWPDGGTYNGFWSHGKKNGVSIAVKKVVWDCLNDIQNQKNASTLGRFAIV